MSAIDLKQDIKRALAQITKDDFGQATKNLLSALGYRSERTLSEQSGRVEDFLKAYPLRSKQSGENSMTKSEKTFIDGVKSVRILFQLTDEELEDIKPNDGEQDSFDDSNIRSFLFIVVELKQGEKNSYSRGRYAEFVQEINKRFSMPVVVLFKTANNLLTLALVYRRPNKKNPERDVIGRVSLVREIDMSKPDSVHLDILTDLSLETRLKWIRQQNNILNFDILLDSWLDALDTEKLNRKFYRELFEWFKRAVAEAKLPEIEMKAEEQVIRLITRILFVWFIKQKDLVAESLFIENKIREYLQNYDSDSGDSYYRAILQNLFFATLNTEIDKRGFSKMDRTTHRDSSYYRFRDEISDVDGLLNLFKQTPFINGGLFECLDSFENYGSGGSRIDFFTDNVNNPNEREYKKISFPNRLFFDKKGLFALFNRYKFTIEENTPIEKEVALDPELIGKAFENLLAAYNPDTRETARKQTGSYYTPTSVVEYMVDEVLVEALAEMAQSATDDDDWWRDRLRYLLDYADACDDAEEIFEPAELDSLVKTISGIKVIDPAVGSGAFPMGILHKLTLALRRLDPNNERWQQIQKERALYKCDTTLDKEDPLERENELAGINIIFQLYRNSDFGRKLYLIQNSIFGVDVQPIACQIAKLRFFISLAIEQEPTEDSENNYGIHPLPNLETQFIAADTLIGLERPVHSELQSPAVLRLKQEIIDNREYYFHANTRDQKWEYRKRDEDLRSQLAIALGEEGFSSGASEKISTWDPYDQNSTARWFDAEYMFGVENGFDIVIGNPPYVKVEHLTENTRVQLTQEYRWLGDLYEHFICRGLDLCNPRGIFSYIVNDSFVTLASKKRIRERFLKNKLLHLVRSPAHTFDASIYVAIFVLKKEPPSPSYTYQTGEFIVDDGLQYRSLDRVSYKDIHYLPNNLLLLAGENDILMRLLLTGQKVDYHYNVLDTGIDSGNVRNKIFFSEAATGRERLLQGRQIERFLLYWDSPKAKYKYCDINYEPRPCPGIGRGGKASSRNEYWRFRGEKENHHQPERLLIRQTEDDLVVAYHNEELHGHFYTDNTLFTILPKRDEKDLKFLMALLNSRLINYVYHFLSQEKGKSQAQVKVKIVRELPVVLPSDEDRSRINELVERILSEKQNNPLADTSVLESQIDQIIYQLYRLNNDEIEVVKAGVTLWR